MGKREEKQALFDELARVAKALASGRRAEIVNLLANGRRSVETIAEQVGLSVANTSQHLQILRRAGLVSTERQGTFVYYFLAGPEVLAFWGALQKLAGQRLAEVDRLASAYLGDRDELEPLSRKELRQRIREKRDLVVLDVRPEEEYRAGHIPGAVSIPITELKRRLRELPDKQQEIVAYCRGPYCVFAHEAVSLLKAEGYKARRLVDGLPEWMAGGLPVEST